MTEKLAAYWVGNVAHARFFGNALRTGPDPVAPVYGVDTPQRWPIPRRARRWFPRLLVRTDSEHAAVSAVTQARVERILAEREAKRLAARPWLCALDGVLQPRNPPAPQ